MRIQIVDGEIVLSEVYNGIGIQTDMGLFGIAQRDGGIEVMLNGKPAWTSHELSAHNFHDAAARSLHNLHDALADRAQSLSLLPGHGDTVRRINRALLAVGQARTLLDETFSIENAAGCGSSPYLSKR
jgi:hypothetical protein